MMSSISLTRASHALQSLTTLSLSRIIQSIVCIIEDHWFDMRYGTDTCLPDNLTRLHIPSKNKNRAVPYAPTKAKHFRSIIETLSFPTDSVFVDIGSGKGKILLLASHYNFKKVRGIEFSPALCRIAKTNVSAYQHRARINTPIEIVESDAADYQIGADENVFFLFNPFDGDVLRQFLTNVGRSLEHNPRKIWLIYNNPIYRNVIEQHSRFAEVKTIVYANTESVVYLSDSSTKD